MTTERFTPGEVALYQKFFKAPLNPKILDHVLNCPSCGYTTNVVGDLTQHRQAKHSRKSHPARSAK
jgi:hypothetical protein